MAVDATAMAGRSLRFDAAAKRRVRAGAAAAGGSWDDPRVREESCRQRGAGCVSGDSRPPPIGALPRRFADCRVSRRE